MRIIAYWCKRAVTRARRLTTNLSFAPVNGKSGPATQVLAATL